MKFNQFALIALFVSKSAFAINPPAAMPTGLVAAPDTKVDQIQSNALLQGFPKLTETLPAKSPVLQNYSMSFRNGLPVLNGAALSFEPGLISSTEARAKNGYATCTADMQRLTMPAATEKVVLEEAPRTGAKEFSFGDDQTMTIQGVAMRFAITDNFGTVTHNTIKCYRVVAKPLADLKPMTLADVRAGLGAGFSIQFSAEQSLAILDMKRAQDALSAASNSLTGPGYETDMAATKFGIPQKNGVVSTTTSGNFNQL